MTTDGQAFSTSIATPTADDVVVEVTAALIPAHVSNGAFWVGRSPEQPEALVGGWGPQTSRVICRRGSLITLPSNDVQSALGLLVMSVINTALSPLLPVQHVGVLGDNAAAALVRAYLAHRGIALTPEPERQSIDLLIDTTGDVAEWGPALATVVTEGSALLLGAARRRLSDYNFYTDMHRRSLKVVSRGWHTPIDPVSLRAVAALAAPAAKVVHDERLVQPRQASSEGVNEVWQVVKWSDAG